MKIIENVIRCNLCGDIIESQRQHDPVWCKCGACAVDGGHECLRRCVKGEKCYTDISVIDRSKEKRNEKNEDISVIACYPKADKDFKVIQLRLARIHAQYVLNYIQELNCPQWQKEELLDAVIKKCSRDNK